MSDNAPARLLFGIRYCLTQSAMGIGDPNARCAHFYSSLTAQTLPEAIEEARHQVPPLVAFGALCRNGQHSFEIMDKQTGHVFSKDELSKVPVLVRT